ncbi:MAG: tetratricopeptide repeat protein [Actinomycetota bacterium]|nr:tetratricopeptide repeat protein [Actinomycetota bacterium]
MSQPIAISLAGTLKVRVGEATTSRPATTEPATTELRLGPRGRVAFAYLVLHRDRPVARDELADAVWGDDLPDTWRPALRLLVSRLRAGFVAAGVGDRDVLRTMDGCYRVSLPGPVTVDVESAATQLDAGARALAGGDTREARRLAIGAAAVARARFLPSDCGPWVEGRQADLQRLLLAALDLASRAASAQGDHTCAVTLAREAVGVEPWEEAGHLRLVGAHAAGGDLAAARRAFDDCRRVLADQLGTVPSVEADATYSRMVAAGATGRVPGNLRLPVSSFVGRSADLAELAARRPGSRVLTLVGPAGVGKSRLALEYASRSGAAHPDGVWAVELAGLPAGGVVASHVRAVLGLREGGTGVPVDALVEQLDRCRVLLVLDNCEHVLGPCAALVEELVGRCPGLDVLATSRTPLGITGETIWTVEPLTVPGADRTGPLAELLGFEAVRLFCERAASVAPGLVLDEVSASVARICRQLDGLPLAIELTAARTRSFGVTEIEARLGDRFRFLVSGGRRTLQAAVDWSYATLASPERRVLARVALFVGGFGLDGARAVCAMPDDEMVDALAGLVDKSLLVADHLRGNVRYRMLETMRQYGAEKLAAEGDGAVAAARDRHLGWACGLAEAADPGLDGPDQPAWLGVLGAEEENLRVAAEWAEESGSPILGARLAVALWRFWEIRGALHEGRRRLEAVAGRAGTPPRLRARALNGAGILAQRQCDRAGAGRLYEAGLALHRRLDDRRGVAAALNGLANLAVSAGELDRAECLYAENVVIGRALGDDRLVAGSLLNLAVVYQVRVACGGDDRDGALGQARVHCEDSLALYRAMGDRHSQAMALENLGSLLALQGDVPSSRRCLDESLAMRRDLGDPVGIAASARFLGHLARRDGRFETARSLAEQSLSLECEVGNVLLAATDLLTLGEIAADQAAFDESRSFFQRSLVMSRDLGDDAGSERALRALAALPLTNW